jgi:hypothetical protein
VANNTIAGKNDNATKYAGNNSIDPYVTGKIFDNSYLIFTHIPEKSG